VERGRQDRLARSLGTPGGRGLRPELAEGVDIRPTIAVTKARIDLPEIHEAIAKGRLKVDGEIVHETATSR
jgi:hypothetical protein